MIAPLIDTLDARQPILDAAGTTTVFLRIQNAVRIAVNGLLSGTSTTSGYLLPRMTTTQRDAITATDGETIFNTTTNKAQTWASGVWNNLF